MNRNNIIIYLLVAVISGISCSGRKSDIEKKDKVPKDKMIDIITDLYLTDGLMMQPRVRDWFVPDDTLAAHKDVIEGHGIQQEDFERTLKFYFIKKPKKLIRMYDQALARLSELEARTEQEMLQEQERALNLWNKSKTYAFPQTADSLAFDIILPYPTVYELYYTLTLFPGEDVINPRATVFTCHPDSLVNGTRNYLETINYVLDGQPHKYIVRIHDSYKNRLRLYGTLFDYDNDRKPGALNVIVEKISIGTGIAEE